MKNKHMEELKKKSKEDLRKAILEAKKTLQEARQDIYSGKVKSAETVRNTKKNIARMYTLEKLHEYDELSANIKYTNTAN